MTKTTETADSRGADFWWMLTPADVGELAVCIDDCEGLGDDETVDRLSEVCADLSVDRALAYHIVHDRGRRIR